LTPRGSWRSHAVIAAALVAVGIVAARPAHATYYSTDTQGTYNTGTDITTANAFDLSGNGSFVVTIFADTTNDIFVSAPSGAVSALQVNGTLLIQPGFTIPGPTDSLIDAAAGPFTLYNAFADPSAGDSATLFTFGAVEAFAIQFTDNGRTYTGYIQGTLDNSSGYLAFSVTDFGSNTPAAGPQSLPTSSQDPQPAPEPASLALLAAGAAATAAIRRRTRRQ